MSIQMSVIIKKLSDSSCETAVSVSENDNKTYTI